LGKSLQLFLANRIYTSNSAKNNDTLTVAPLGAHHFAQYNKDSGILDKDLT
jgi:hypothetical protein